MATSSTSRTTGSGIPFAPGSAFDAGQVHANVLVAMGRVRELNERAMKAAWTSGEAGLDAYEKAMRSFMNVEEPLRGTDQLDWVKAIVGAQAEFVQNVSGAYVTAARDLWSKK